MLFKSLRLKNFTVFKDAAFEFVPGVNVLVGANGTGKTHALKALSYMQFVRADRAQHPPLTYLFAPDLASRDLLSSGDVGQATRLEVVADNGIWSAEFKDEPVDAHEHMERTADKGPAPRPVFIPSVDMLAHTRRFLATYENYDIDFDRTYRDIVLLLLSPEKRQVDDMGINLQGLTGGLALGLVERDERFYVETPAGLFAAPMMAGGIRKLATVVQLIRNGWIHPGSILYWDEPEVSLSPSLMGELVAAILKMSRAGVQIFLATHSYELLKELDLQAQPGEVTYFGLELADSGVAVHPANSYDELRPNKIEEEFDSLYDRQLTRATRRSRKSGDGR